jgi:hypothetical protein
VRYLIKLIARIVKQTKTAAKMMMLAAIPTHEVKVKVITDIGYINIEERSKVSSLPNDTGRPVLLSSVTITTDGISASHKHITLQRQQL